MHKIEEIEYISTKTERQMEYANIIRNSLAVKLSNIDEKDDYTFFFRFYTNGREHAGTNATSTKLQKLYFIPLIKFCFKDA